MKCPKCNEELEKGAKFCTKCGANIEQALAERVQAEAKIKEKEEAELKAKMEADAKQREEQSKLKQNDEIYDEEVKEKIEELKNEENVEAETKKTDAKFEKKETNKKKKKHIGLKIIFILILVLIILAAGIYGLYKLDVLPNGMKDFLNPMFETVEKWFGNEKNEEKEEEKNVVKIEEENETLGKIDKKEDLVYDYYTTKLNGSTSRIPVINLDNDNIKDINDDIKELTEDKLKEAEKLVSEDNFGLINVDYRWYQNDEVLSLILVLRYGTGKNEYHVFNVSTTDGKNIENTKILDMAKISDDDFIDKCVDATKDYFDKLYDVNDPIYTEATGYSTARANTVDEDNFSVSRTQMYLNDSGELMIVAKIYTLAGAGQDEKLINLENMKRNVVNTSSVSNTIENDTNTTN